MSRSIFLFTVLFLFSVIISLFAVLDTTFQSGIAMRNNQIILNLSESDSAAAQRLIVEKISSEKIKLLIKDNNGRKTVVQLCGSWCPSVTLGLDLIKEVSKYRDKVNILLISADICTKEQVEILKNVLFANGIQINSYVIENNFWKSSDLAEFQTTRHIIEFVKSFYPAYKPLDIKLPNGSKLELAPVPYLCILDEKGGVVYTKAAAIPENPSAPVPAPENFFKVDINEVLKVLGIN